MDTTEKQIRDMFCNSGPFDRDEIALLMLQLVERIQNLEQAPQRQWVGLTQEEFDKLIDDAGFTRSDLLMIGACVEQIVDLVEKKLKEKNHA